MSKLQQTGHRIDLQILRAVAVLSVAIYHFWPSALPGGFAGVDVFFVISGFLITSLIAREIERTGKLNLANFWIRRIRRIFPAAATVIVFVVVAVATFGGPRQVSSLASHTIASVFSAENFLLWWESTDYDAGTNSASALQHYWSLAVEEQFYLVWPLILVSLVPLALRINRPFLSTSRIVILALGGASFIYAMGRWVFDNASYFDPFARVWELALGAAVALGPTLLTSMSARLIRITRGVSWLGLIPVFLVDGLEKYVPGVGVLPAVFLATIIVALPTASVEHESTVVRTTKQALVWVGDRSFSIYLWHWPILLLAPFVINRELTFAELVLLFVGVLAISDLTFRFVENPARRSRRKWLSTPLIIFPTTLGVCVTLTASVLVLPVNFGIKELPIDYLSAMRDEPRDLTAVASDSPARNYPFVEPHCGGAASAVFDCPSLTGVVYDPRAKGQAKELGETSGCEVEDKRDPEICLHGDVTSNRRIALIGDSHSGTWQGAIDDLGVRAGAAVVFFTRPGCGFRADAAVNCEIHNEKTRDKIINGNYELVIIAQLARDENRSRYTEALDFFVERGIPVVVIKDNTFLPPEAANCVSYTFPDIDGCALPRSESVRSVDTTVDAAKELGIPVIDFTDIYCGAQTCAVSLGGYQVHRNGGHMYRSFLKTLTPFLWSDLRELGYFAD
jgi:peptidoglycan/LPS O-acetylase OafA/YrhL